MNNPIRKIFRRRAHLPNPRRRSHVRRRAVIAPAALAVAIMLTPELAHAYVDPGIVGFLITTILGSIAAVGYLARAYIARMKRWLKRGGKPETQTPGEPSDQPDDAEK